MDMILNNEEIVYNVILDYLNQNRPFRISEILPYITSRFAKASININEIGVKEILRSLIQKKLLVEGSVLTRNELIQNPKRKQIFYIVRDNPGIIFNGIVKKSNFSNYIVYWHMSILLKFGCVNKAMVGKHQIFFDSRVDVEDATVSLAPFRCMHPLNNDKTAGSPQSNSQCSDFKPVVTMGYGLVASRCKTIQCMFVLRIICTLFGNRCEATPISVYDGTTRKRIHAAPLLTEPRIKSDTVAASDQQSWRSGKLWFAEDR